MSLANWRRDELGQKPNDLETVQDGSYTVTRPVYREKPRHTLTLVGWPGQRRAYLDMTREAALWRFEAEAQPTPNALQDIARSFVDVFEFTDTFGVTDIWETGNEIWRTPEEREESLSTAIGLHPSQADLADDAALDGQGE